MTSCFNQPRAVRPNEFGSASGISIDEDSERPLVTRLIF